MRKFGVIPVASCTLDLYAAVTKLKCLSHLVSSSLMKHLTIDMRVLLKRSVFPLSCGCLGLVRVFLIWSNWHISWNNWLSKLVPWSEWILVGQPNLLSTSLTNFQVTVNAVWSGIPKASAQLVKWSVTVSMYLFYWESSVRVQWCQCRVCPSVHQLTWNQVFLLGSLLVFCSSGIPYILLCGCLYLLSC